MQSLHDGRIFGRLLDVRFSQVRDSRKHTNHVPCCQGRLSQIYHHMFDVVLIFLILQWAAVAVKYRNLSTPSSPQLLQENSVVMLVGWRTAQMRESRRGNARASMLKFWESPRGLKRRCKSLCIPAYLANSGGASVGRKTILFGDNTAPYFP